MAFTTATTADLVLLSLCSFLGNIGKAVTGFGMAIIFLFVWQIVELAGYEGDFKYAVFVQSLALFAVQPLALYDASVIKNSYRYILLLFVPITLVSTPLGQLVSDMVPTKTIQAVAGVLVTLVAIWEIYTKRNWFMSPCKKRKKKEKGDEEQAVEADNTTVRDTIELMKDSEKNVATNDEGSADVEGETQSTQQTADEGETQSQKQNPDEMGASGSGANVLSSIKEDDFDDNQVSPTQGIGIKANESDPETSPPPTTKRGTVLALLGGGASEVFQGNVWESTRNAWVSRRTLNTTQTNNNEPAAESDRPPNAAPNGATRPAAAADEFKIGPNKATFWTLIAGGASGFLGGMVAIRGPPLIFYFLHPPRPVKFNKTTQRATATVITFFNVFMRQIFYFVNTFAENSSGLGYQKEDWRLYLSVIICSVAGAMVGNKMFEYLKDSKDTIRGILAVFLFMCGVSLLFSAFRR